jgi:hypothetical protein
MGTDAGRVRRINAKSKYRAVPTEVDGIRFASKKEAKRYAELKLLERAGKIFRLRLQPRFRLCPWTTLREGDGEAAAVPHLGYYVADFAYCNQKDCMCVYGCQVEDAKGFKTPLYKWKKKHVELQYRLTVREV